MLLMRHRAWLLSVTAVIEVGAGLALLIVPSVPLELLLGVSVAVPETLLIGRVTGAALLAIGVASWLARGDRQGHAQLGVLTGVLIYDGAAAALLGYAGLAMSMAGALLWPAVVIHSALAVWCLMCLRSETRMAGRSDWEQRGPRP
jgi:hypothetical protein